MLSPMLETAKALWNAPIRHAPWGAAGLLVLAWSEALTHRSVAWLWVVPVAYWLIWMPRGGMISRAQMHEFEPTAAELMLAVASVGTIAFALISGTFETDGGGLYLYPVFALGLLQLRMNFRSRNRIGLE